MVTADPDAPTRAPGRAPPSVRTITNPNPEVVEVPDFDGDGYELWRWLRERAEERGERDYADSLEIQGSCPAQTIAKCTRLAERLGIVIDDIRPYIQRARTAPLSGPTDASPVASAAVALFVLIAAAGFALLLGKLRT